MFVQLVSIPMISLWWEYDQEVKSSKKAVIGRSEKPRKSVSDSLKTDCKSNFLMGGQKKRKGYVKLFQPLTSNTLADDHNWLTQFELAIATKSNLFLCTLLYETRPYIDTGSVKNKISSVSLKVIQTSVTM